jgi:predicted membrane protein
MILSYQTAVRRLIIIAILHIILSLSTHSLYSDINIQRAELRIRYKKRHIIIEIGIKMHDALALTLFILYTNNIRNNNNNKLESELESMFGLYVVAFYEFMLKEISA